MKAIFVDLNKRRKETRLNQIVARLIKKREWRREGVGGGFKRR